jgi:hypothetical protein
MADPYRDVEFRHSETAKTQAFADEDVQSDEMPPRADYRHESLMKMLAVLDTSVIKLGSRLETVLAPERPEPTNGELDRQKEGPEYSIVEQRHRMYMQVLDDITRRVKGLVERVDL